MALNFPNPSRCFDAKRNSVQFWGHDNTKEITFFVEGDALCKLLPKISRVEEGFLSAFDTARNQILYVATSIYGRSRGQLDSYVLSVKHF